MGMTLPILVKELCKYEGQFGKSLGYLYGWNAVGAVIGILISEFYFIHWFGIQRTGYLATTLNLFIALIIFNQFSLVNSISPRNFPDKPVLNPSIYRLLLTAFFSGAILLGLEIICFRFMLLYIS